MPVVSQSFPPQLTHGFRVGENMLKIKAASRGNDVDDFEFVNVQIHMTRGLGDESRK